MARQKCNLLVLNESSRDLLKRLNFHEIPDNATHIAFMEDGSATFVDEFTGPFMLPQMVMLMVYQDIEADLEF